MRFPAVGPGIQTASILFAQSTGGPLPEFQLREVRRWPRRKWRRGQTGHRFPRFLPGGRQFLFLRRRHVRDGRNLHSAHSTPRKPRVWPRPTRPVFMSPPGWLLFVRQGTLVAQRLDLARGELTGDPGDGGRSRECRR